MEKKVPEKQQFLNINHSRLNESVELLFLWSIAGRDIFPTKKQRMFYFIDSFWSKMLAFYSSFGECFQIDFVEHFFCTVLKCMLWVIDCIFASFFATTQIGQMKKQLCVIESIRMPHQFKWIHTLRFGHWCMTLVHGFSLQMWWTPMTSLLPLMAYQNLAPQNHHCGLRQIVWIINWSSLLCNELNYSGKKHLNLRWKWCYLWKYCIANCIHFNLYEDKCLN